LSTAPTHWSTIFIIARVASIAAMAASDGLARLGRGIGEPRWQMRFVYAVSRARVLLSSLLPGRLPLWTLLSRATTTRAIGPGRLRCAQAASLARSVVAQAAIAPHLSERIAIYSTRRCGPDADYVIGRRVSRGRSTRPRMSRP